MIRATLGCMQLVLFVGLSSCLSSGEPRRVDTAERVKPTANLETVAAKLPGKCVDPVNDGDERDPSRPFGKHVQLDVRSDDLDGDGVADTFVMPAWPCGISCNRSAYVVASGSSCGHYVGTFPSTDAYSTLEHKTNGLHDLSVRPRKMGSDGELHCYNNVLAFDGKAYREIKHRECECKDEGAKCTAWEE